MEPHDVQPASDQPVEPPRARPVPARPVMAAGIADRPPPSAERPLDLSGLTVAQAWLDLLLVFAVGVLGPNLPLIVHGWFGIEGDAVMPTALIVAAKWGEMIAAVTLLAYLLASRRLRPAVFGLSGKRPVAQLGWSLLTVLAVYGYLMLSVLVIQTLVQLGLISLDQQIAQRVEFAEKLPVGGWTTVVLLVAVAIHEEVLFRGLLLTYLRRVSGSWSIAVVGVSAIFAVLHIQQGTLAVVQVFGLSVVLCLMFIASRSLPALIAAHFVFDLIQFQLIHLLPQMQRVLEQGS